jgi:hypothetical protein
MKCYKCKKEIDNQGVEGLHERCFVEWFELPAVEGFTDIAAQRIGNDSGPISQLNSSFFHGKFKKYSAQLGNRQYILKVQQPEYPELPATEYLCNEIAKSLQIQVPDFYLIRFQNQWDTFVSRNFMSDRLSSNLIHFYRFLENNQEFDCKTVIQIIKRETGKMNNIDKFIELCLFDALIGNHDRHGRNLALIQNPKGLELAPFYDNPSYIAIEDEWLLAAHHEPRGKIFTSHSREPKMREYVLELMELGFGINIKTFMGKIDLEHVSSLIHESFISEKRKNALHSLIKRRYQELIHAI